MTPTESEFVYYESEFVYVQSTSESEGRRVKKKTENISP